MALRITGPLTIAVTVLFDTAKAFNLTECKASVIDKITQNPNITKDRTVFYGETIDKNNLQLRYAACEAICGGGNNTIAGDCGPRLAAWVLPILILVGSMKLPPLAWRQKLWAVLALSGNPMGSQSRMVAELRLYEQCIREGDRAATVLLSRLCPEQVPDKSMTTTATQSLDEKSHQNLVGNFARIIHAFSRTIIGQSPPDTRLYLEQAIREMAKRANWKEALIKFRDQVDGSGKALIDQTSRSTVMPLIAVACFIFPVVIALVPQVAGGFASGGMMASILTLSPFILMVCLSNSIGEYSNLKQVSDKLKEVIESIPDDTRQQLAAGALYPSVDKDVTDLLEYSLLYRRGSSVRDDRKKSLLSWVKRIDWLNCFLLLSFPLGIASAGGAIGTRPVFFQDRHILLIMVFVGWAFNWQATRFVVSRYNVGNPPRGKRPAWMFIAATHLLVAISGPIFLAGITCGLLGGCKMWSGYYRYGAQDARIPLNVEDDFERNGHRLYPGLATTCLGVNVVAFFVLRYCVFSRVFCVIAGKDDKIAKKNSNVEIDSEAGGTIVQVAS